MHLTIKFIKNFCQYIYKFYTHKSVVCVERQVTLICYLIIIESKRVDDQLINNEIRKIIRNQVNKYSCGERECVCETSWERILAVPSLVFLRSWSDSPTVRSRGNNLIGLRSQPLVPRRFILLLPCRPSFSFSPSSAGHFKPFNPPCRGSSTSNWMPPRKAWPLSWSIPLGLLIVRLGGVDCTE